jgi:hypothetical protein
MSAAWAICCRIFATSLSESTFRKGDWRREMLSAVLSVSSKTESPVLFSKSARDFVFPIHRDRDFHIIQHL